MVRYRDAEFSFSQNLLSSEHCSANCYSPNFDIPHQRQHKLIRLYSRAQKAEGGRNLEYELSTHLHSCS
jgi:hypothetical protein